MVSAPSARDDATVALARRVLAGFREKCGRTCAQRVILACASDDEGMPEKVHRYLRLGFSEERRLYTDVAAPEALALDALVRHVSTECEHTRQFVRFTKVPDGTFVAAFEPNANTLPLVGSHFSRRMREDRFLIVDPRHLVAIMHGPEDKGFTVVGLDSATAEALAARTGEADEQELYIHAMWRRFYQAMSLEGRSAAERGYDLRVKWMPKRFWKGMPEFGA